MRAQPATTGPLRRHAPVARLECGCPKGSLHIPRVRVEPACGRHDPDGYHCDRQADHGLRHCAIWHHCGRVRAVWGERARAEVAC